MVGRSIVRPALAVVVVMTAAWAAFAQSYKVTAIPTLGGPTGQAFGINASGQVSGFSAVTSSSAHASIYANGKLTDLGTLGGEYSATVKGGQTLNYHAFVVTGGKLQDLNRLIPANSGWVLQEATGINDAGQIVGYGTFRKQLRGFLLTPTK